MHLRLALVAAAAVCFGAAATAQDRKPNIVFLLVDDLGWKDLGCYGSSFYETPNVDRLAAGGMRFTNAYAACCVCSPTRASIMAGKYPARMNTTDYFGGGRKGKLVPARYVNRLPHEETTIAEALREAGYATGFFGKWHLGNEPFTPESQGFDVNKGGVARGQPPAGYFSPYKNPKLSDGPKGEYLTERLTEEALRFLDASKDKPFLLFFSYYNVHTPLQAKKDLIEKYEKKRESLPKHDGPEWLPEGRRKCRQVQNHARYAAMVQAVDDSVGRILARVEEHGLGDDTIVVLFSDNGGLSTSEGHPTSNVPLRAGKGWNYEGGIREPMIVRWPGRVKGGSTSDVPVISTDFYPTLLQMAGLPLRPEQHVDGTSLVSVLTGSGKPQRDAIYWHYPHYGNQGGSPSGAIRAGDWKLIEFFEDDRIELYNLARDLGESTDLASKEPERAQDLRNRLHAWRKKVDARMPTPNPNWKGRRKRRSPQNAKARPNILWVTCEDISAHLGCYGSLDAITPNLDRLAGQGVRYTHAYAPIGVCAPARSCLITGMYPNSLGTQYMRCKGILPKRVRCFPEYLRKAGYYCTNRSKTDYNFRHAKSTWDASNRKADWQGRKPGQPFFSVINLTVTHEGQVRLPDARFAKRTQRLKEDQRRDPKRVQIPPYHPDTEAVRRDWARYHDLITIMDKQVGDLLRRLEKDGLADDTIVFFYSDHGAGLPRSKRWLYESSTHVPLIVRFPKKWRHLAPSEAGTTSSRLVSFVDFAPTVLSLAGVSIPKHMQGRAFLGKGDTSPRRYVYGFRDRMDERYDMMRCVRGERFRYIRNYMPHLRYSQFIEYCTKMPTWRDWTRLAGEGKLSGPSSAFFAESKPPEELYDTLKDPHEIRNLASDPNHRETLRTMRKSLREWMTRIRDVGFLPEGELRRRFAGRAVFDAVRRNRDEYPFGRLLAAAELGRGGGIRALPKLRRLLADPEAGVRWWATTAAISLGAPGKALRTAVVELLGDPSPSVRVAACQMLCRLGEHADALPVLRTSLAHENEWVRLRAAGVIDRLDGKAASLQGELERLRKDENKYVQRVARKALADLR